VGKDVGGEAHGLYSFAILAFVWRKLKKIINVLVMTGGTPVQIQTTYLRLEYHSYTAALTCWIKNRGKERYLNQVTN
jgi:hypothetical protein